MKYEIKGESLPVVVCFLEKNEQIVSEAGAMGWMSDSIVMNTNMKGGILGGLGRVFSGESVFLNTFTSNIEDGYVAFPSSFPGKIIARYLENGESVVAQKGAFLAAQNSVELKVDFRKKLGAGFFGGEGFILQRIHGPGMAFFEFDGFVDEIMLAPGQRIKVDTGNVAMFESSVSYDIALVKGVKNIFFGGEGLFLTTLTGPGKVYVQSMPMQNLAGQLGRYFETSSK